MRIRIENWPKDGNPNMIMVTAFPLETDDQKLTYWKQHVEREANRALTHDVPEPFRLDDPIEELVFGAANLTPEDQTVRVHIEDLDLQILDSDVASAVTGLLISRLGSYLAKVFPRGTRLIVMDTLTEMQRPFTRPASSGAAAAR